MECIFEGRASRVYRAIDEAGRKVVVKQLRELYPGPASLARFAREFEITRGAAGPNVIEAYEMRVEDGTASLVLEDFGASSLAHHLRQCRFEIPEILRIGIQVAEGLDHLHRLSIVHRDINPANLVWNSRSEQVKIIDFGISQVLGRSPVGVTSGFSGTPAYMSPEQTGRMNRDVDSRSDLYSLGVTLYELLTRRRPFESDDPLELVHSHLARNPVPPDELVEEIPPSLGELVMVLLSKRAEDRYASAAGLKHDLETCLKALEAGRGRETFALRLRDHGTELRIPQKLYGRESQTELLLAAFERAAQGHANVLLVAGQAGVGKTSLVHEVHRPLTRRRGIYVEGKFDQLNRGIPHDSLIQAFRSFIRQILTEPEDQIDGWRRSIQTALGKQAQVLIEVLPELEHVLGPQPAIEALGPTEARNRFQMVMASFVRAIGTAEHPLVLFLDDLQWADLPSLELLGQLACEPEARHLLMVGAYRHNEVTPSHPLATALKQMESQGARIETLTLGPLEEKDILQLVGDTVGESPGYLRLALICQHKTRGNAFFLTRFLESLYERGLLGYEPAQQCWCWDLDQIQSQDFTANVVDFMAAQLARLPEESRQALQLAACVGNSFDLARLAHLQGLTRRQTLELLRQPLRANLILPTEEDFWYAEMLEGAGTNFGYRFAHDRVQQAAYAMLEPAQANHIHLRVARLLQAEASQDPTALFTLVEHMNRAAALLVGLDERRQLAELNLEAGRRALRSAAFEPAHQHYLRAFEHLPEEDWEGRYELALAVHLEGARAAYLGGYYDLMEARLEVVARRAGKLLDRVEGQEIRIQALIAQQRLPEAVYQALEVLELLGFGMDPNPSFEDVQTAVALTLGMIGGHDLEALPAAEHAEAVAAVRIQNGVMAAAYLAVPLLLPMLCCNMVSISLRHGLSPDGVYAFSVLALVLVSVNQLEAARQLAGVAAGLGRRWDVPSHQCKNLHVIDGVVNGYLEPLRRAIDNHRLVYRLSLDCGDLEYAGWGLHNEIANSFWAGIDLLELAATIEHHTAVMEHHKMGPALACTYPMAQLVRNLMMPSPNPARLAGDHYDEEAHLARMLQHQARGAVFCVAVAGLISRYHFGALEEALERAEHYAEYADGVQATYQVVAWHQYRALTILRLDRPDEVESSLARVAPNLQFLAGLAQGCPANFVHRVSLLEAECARLQGRRGEAQELYEAAIAQARDHQFIQDEALANELAGRFLYSLGNLAPARGYLLQAIFLYGRWGAAAKTEALEKEFAEPLAGFRHFMSARRRGTTATVSFGHELDLAAAIRASHAISSQIVLAELVQSLVRLVLETAGAQRGLLLLESEGGLQVVCEGWVDTEIQLRSLELPAADYAECPQSVIHYVRRTREAVILHHASQDSTFCQDDYIQSRSTGSILCLPVKQQNELSAVLYLENDLTTGAFTDQQLDLLRLLAAQAAISIRNAQLYNTLEQRVAERTRELSQEIEERTRVQEELRVLATTDSLTGAANRRRFLELAEQEFQRSRRYPSPLTAVMLDADYFKTINDSYGHDVGDQVLRALARVVASQLRVSEVFGRMGGEEFAIAMPSTDAQGAAIMAERLRQAVAALELEARDEKVRFTISIGIAELTPADTSFASILARADAALYQAKTGGRNLVVVAEPGYSQAEA
ncbi:MAG: diguanylate cyclase [Vulcanimicrobiota bacterium]